MDHKDYFFKVLEGIGGIDLKSLVPALERYAELLYEVNLSINLVSRKMEIEKYWTQHFLDSLLILKCLNLSGQVFLDFGCGGGLPGIPLKLAQPDCTALMLDSSHKKIYALEEMIGKLGLGGVKTFPLRLEEYAASSGKQCVDYILCRAVAMESRYHLPCKRLLKKNGKMYFYKSHKLDDLKDLKFTVEYETQDEVLGFRRFISVCARDL
ncbi:MAG: 16S rRNA (guanine(527)-N(7))-methyltransferase RsmG [Candidatus Cloacimonetes bacterium]|nr:16S rRNA (guanine(527)-N(7))-methyltransferase RsmG [Candidatus Cloacimonadota bacterium]